MLIREKLRGFDNAVFRSKAGIWAMGHLVPKHRNVLAVLTHEGGRILIPASNIVTTAGDRFYAEVACGESPNVNFAAAGGGLRLGSANTSPTKADTDVTTFLAGTAKAIDAGYRRTADNDGDNTGSGTNVITWRVSYSTSEGNANGIVEGAIVNDRTTPGSALTHFLFASSFNKTSSDTLKVFVNHSVQGV